MTSLTVPCDFVSASVHRTARDFFFMRPFVGILSKIKLLLGLLVIQLVWYTKTIIHLSVGESGIHLHFGE